MSPHPRHHIAPTPARAVPVLVPAPTPTIAASPAGSSSPAGHHRPALTVLAAVGVAPWVVIALVVAARCLGAGGGL